MQQKKLVPVPRPNQCLSPVPICVGEAGGVGVLENPHLNEESVSEHERSYLQHLRGGVH